jgi:hypothetical protein
MIDDLHAGVIHKPLPVENQNGGAALFTNDLYSVAPPHKIIDFDKCE